MWRKILENIYLLSIKIETLKLQKYAPKSEKIYDHGIDLAYLRVLQTNGKNGPKNTYSKFGPLSFNPFLLAGTNLKVYLKNTSITI